MNQSEPSMNHKFTEFSQKKPFKVLPEPAVRGVPRKKCSENMQQIYRRTSMPKYDFSKVSKQHGVYVNTVKFYVLQILFDAENSSLF